MARKPQDNEAAARAAAEAAMPGWEAAPATQVGGTAVEADYSGSDTATLKAKYLGETAKRAKPGAQPAADASFVEMKPKGEGPVKSRKVVVSGGNVTGFQG